MRDASQAPRQGEQVDEIAVVGSLAIEQILSGEVDPVDYLQDRDEWVVVLDGSAVLEVDGERHELVRGDWIFLPAGTPHRLVSTEAGTNWLAVHIPAPP